MTEKEPPPPDQAEAWNAHKLLGTIIAGLERVSIGVNKNASLDEEARMEIGASVAHARSTLEKLSGSYLIFELPDAATAGLAAVLANLDKAVYEAEQRIIELDTREALTFTANILFGARELMRRVCSHAGDSPEKRDLEFQRQIIDSSVSTLALLDKREQIARVGEEVQQIADDVQEAAGATASSEIAVFYQEKANSERLRHALWNVVLFGATAGTVGLSWFVVSHSPGASFTAHELARVTMALPVLLLAAYAARQASYHRNAESEAGSVAVQLKTVRAFSDALDPHGRQEMLRLLGTKIFGTGSPFDESSTGNAERQNTEGLMLPSEVVEILRNALTPSQRTGTSP
ncbi:hypothetical protein F6X54_25410 [Micromonospora aurantiaca]|uniref:Uncharacterized protein n=1 Tax=Micromonospora aurantiaca (nom. illeg.) TaxID=47850 RepID=A0ABQ6UBB3_9ACTN|nr:hypothetical protein [Micromonospora aurantiaca]KAB1107711.1 hypothetical protein F6X54_25410 [Micromonospora aurantiaca]